MKTSQELERELAEVKAKERTDSENKEMAQLIEAYVGKAFGNKAFTQKAKICYYNAVLIESIKRLSEHKNGTEAGTIVCTYRSISFHFLWLQPPLRYQISLL